jgi:hypothetical protein
MGLSWQGSEYSIVLLPPGVFVTDPPNLPAGAITQDNYTTSNYDAELVNGFSANGKPYKYFRVNNPGLGAWTYAVVENTPPPTGQTEPIRVYMSNEADLVLEFKSDQERYYLQYDQNGDPIPVIINLEATVIQGGETSGFNDHTKTVGEPVNDAIVSVQITSPDSQIVAGRLAPSGVGDGTYTIALETILTGNYDIKVIVSDNVTSGNNNNSQYLITTEHSFYVSPYVDPLELTGKLYIQRALNELLAIKAEFCPTNNNCSWDNQTKQNINNAISYINTALGYFEVNDGNHLKTTKGLSFYAKITSSVNNIYSYLSDPDFGNDIDLSLNYLIEGSYKLAVIVRDEAELAGACQVSNCEELLENTNRELGKAIDEKKQDHYVYILNHLTNAWKFAMNVMGANLNKVGDDDGANLVLPTEYGLDQNYPNPFNPSTTISYQLPEKNHVSLNVYDILGNLVSTLVDREMEAGYYNVNWNASQLASGIYIYRIISGSFVSTKKMILMK